MSDDNREHLPHQTSFGEDVKSEVKSWLRWALAGAVIGALAVGGLGFYLLAMTGALYGAVIGTAVGAVGFGWFAFDASSGF